MGLAHLSEMAGRSKDPPKRTEEGAKDRPAVCPAHSVLHRPCTGVGVGGRWSVLPASLKPHRLGGEGCQFHSGFQCLKWRFWQ